MNEDKIDPLLKCRQCNKPYTDPVLIPQLDERFCRSCIYQNATLFQQLRDDTMTSLSGILIPIDEKLLHELLGSLPVQCVACGEKNILRKYFSTHSLQQCPKRTVLCKASDLKCSWSGTYEQSEQHIQQCTSTLR